jgi:3-hydroxymyristoyl/3-hydroxydecanoyl-(acyl carrier protein) dehydratase
LGINILAAMNSDILTYIPQRAPFIMIGEVVSADEHHTQTTLDIMADNLFVNNGFFTEPGLIENIAQTAGAGTGYMAKKNGRPTPMGYIAALQNINILELPRVNETITTDIIFQQVIRNFHQVTGKVTVGGKEIANCEIKIFVNPDQPNALQ